MKNGRHWPLIIVGMIVGNFVAVGTLIYLSGSAGSDVVVDDDYYERAVTHDETMAQQRENVRLGWRASVALTAQPGASNSNMEVTLVGSDGSAIAGAALSMTAYHRARAGERHRLTLQESVAGTYTASMRTTRRGLWQVSLLAKRGAQIFTHDIIVDLGNTGAQEEGERR